MAVHAEMEERSGLDIIDLMSCEVRLPEIRPNASISPARFSVGPHPAIDLVLLDTFSPRYRS